MVQIAQKFETPHSRSGLEGGMRRMIALVSLYLEDASDGDIEKAIEILNKDSLLGLSRSGSEMVKELGSTGAEHERMES